MVKYIISTCQHFNGTYRNIIGHNMLYTFGHPVPICCDMLCVVGSSFMVKFFGCCMMLYSFGHIHATLLLLNIHTNLIFYFKAQQAIQHVATYCNRVAKHVQHFVPNKLAICCVGNVGGVFKRTHLTISNLQRVK